MQIMKEIKMTAVLLINAVTDINIIIDVLMQLVLSAEVYLQ